MRDRLEPYSRYGRPRSQRSNRFYLGALIIAALGLLFLTPFARELIWFLLTGLLVIGVHEGGHVLAGKLTDFRCPVVKIGPFAISRKYGEWRVRYIGGWWDGAAYAEPLHTFDLRRREMVLVAGGPLASFALSLVLWGLSLLLDPHPDGANRTWIVTCADALQGIAAFSWVVAALNLIPFRSGELRSDGLRLFNLLREMLQSKMRRW